MSRRKLLLETIEDRILCDAAPQVDPEALEAAKKAAATQTAVKATGPITVAEANAQQTTAPHATAPEVDSTTAAAQLTDEQRAAVESMVKESTNTIWFQENVGQFAPDVRYGFKTQFGSMLVYDDHIQIIANQVDPETGEVGLHAVDINFEGSNFWQVVAGQESGVLGSYQQADGTTLTPHIYKEVTLRNVYDGIDLRLYSADQGVLEFDWLVAKAQDYEKIKINFTGQDGLIFGADGSATLDLRFQDLTLKMPEVYQVIDGQKQLLGSAMVAGDTPGQMRYSLSGNIVSDQPLVIDPNVAWATYFDLNDTSAGNAFDSYIFAVQVNSAGVYCAGWVKETITNGSYSNYMQVNAGFSQGTATNQNYIYRLSTDGTSITAWTSTGIAGSANGSSSANPPTDLDLFPDGRVLVAFQTGAVQIYSANLATRSYNATPNTMNTINSLAIVNNNTFYLGGTVSAASAAISAGSGLDDTFAGGTEGIIFRYTLNGVGTPVADWATYVGGSGAENFTAIALTPDLTKLVFVVHSIESGTSFGADGYPALVNAVDSTADTVANQSELLTGVIADSATKPAAFSVFSLLGGSGSEGLAGANAATAVVVASNTGYWVGGNTASTSFPGVNASSPQATNAGGTNDAFISFIPINGSAGSGFQSTFLGGTGAEIAGGLAYDPVRDRLLFFGTTASTDFPTLDTTPTSIYYDNAQGGGLDIFIATYTGDLLTKDYATYIGGTDNDYLGDTGALRGTGHVTYSSATDQVYLATTVHSTLPTNVLGGTIPGYDKTKSNTTNDVHTIFAFNISIFDHGDVPLSYENGSLTTAAADALSLTIRIGATVDAEVSAQPGATATGDDVFNTGAADDEDGIATLPTLLVDATTYSVNVSVLNNTGSAKTLQGWIDFNKNGIFEAGERATVSVPTNASQQSVTLTWSSLPANMSAGQSYLRLRFTENTLTDNGATSIDERSFGVNNVATGHGEVEDYSLPIVGASISGTVYQDTNSSGALNGGETGIANVSLTLTGVDDLGNAVSMTTTTDSSGNYTFAGLRKSNAAGYTITETQPPGYIDGVETAGTSGGTVSNVLGTDTISAIVISSTATNATGYNFGEVLASSLSGTVYEDDDNSGTINGGDTGINGVLVTLTGTDSFGQAVSQTFTTPADGTYSFTNLRPGTYTITETQPGAYLDGKETVGAQASGTIVNTADSNTISNITLAQNVTGSGNLFGELRPASLSGFVYGDLSNLGVKDGFESGISGVTVTLTGTDDRGASVNIPATTSATGAYSFANLRPGTYTISETQPPGYTDGADTLGTGLTAPNSAGSAAVNDTFSAITIASVASGNNAGSNYNFGESPSFGLTKSLQASSVAGTSGSNLAIGEVATFRLVITVPTGTFNDFQIQDALPNGFQFLNNGTAVVAFVSNPSGAITSTTLSGGSLQQTAVGTPTFVLPDTAISTSSTANNDTYNSGTDVFFKLGDVTNTDTTGATTESIVIEFQALVVNEAANQAATSLPNTFSVLFEKNGVAGPEPHGGNSNTVTSTVVEPVLAVTKALITSGSDAGDAVQYTITITNAAGNNATAYDINVADLLDTDILLNNVTLGSGIVVTGATVSSNTSTTSNLSLVLDSLAAGSSATITLNATVASTAAAGNTVTNGTTITWTSTPGINANERNGTGTPALNDYTASANSATFVLSRPTVDKLTPSDTTYSIGETVTYDILVTLPEGVTTGLSITDNLPAGLDFVSVAVQTAAGGTLANAFNGTVGAPTTSNVGNSYTFTFGDTTTTGDNVANNNSFLVRVTARVANTVGNQNAVVLTNTATLAYTDGTNGGSIVNDPTPNVSITVVEPTLTLDKATVGTVTGLDAGDTVQYSITITNTGTATAHEVTLNDALPAGLLVTTIDSTTPAGGATVDTATGGTGTATLTGEYTIPAGGSITILYTATLQSTVTPNANYLNTATVTFSSVDGIALGQGTAAGERVGTSPNIQGDGSLNDYRLQDTAQVSTGGVLTIAKGVNNSTPSIGDVLTYTVTLTLNEGTTQNIVVTDTLPASGDLQYVAGSAAVSFGTGGSSISGSATPAISGANSNVLTFTLGDATVSAGAGANTVVLTYQVVVTNVATNQAGDVEGNSAHVTATNLTTPPDSTTSVTLREPNVTFTKTPDKTTNVDAGDFITYTIVLTNPGGANASTAFDALLTDTMPSNLLVTGITSTTFAGGATADSAAAITGGGTGLSGQYDIPVGATVTIVYTATVQSSFPTNGSLTNGAVLTWTSVNGGNSNSPDANERYGASGSTFGDGSLNDYRRTTNATTTGAAPTFSKVLFSTSDATTAGGNVTLGEQVTYALVVTLPEGTTSGFNVSDTLPAGLRYVSSSIVTTSAASNGLLAANFNGTVPAPGVSGGAADGDDVAFTFGSDISTTGDNVTNNNTFLILVTTVVTDVPANVGVSLPNSATFTGTGIPPTTPPPVNVTVVEPRLQVTKSVDDPTADLGQTLTYTLTIQHTGTSTATAYDLIIRDAIPSGFTLNTGSVSITGGTIATNTSTASQLALTIDQLNVGGTITITYTATVGTGAALGGTNQDNNARLYWDTTPADTGTNIVLNGGTDGDDDHDYGATPGYTEGVTPSPDDPAQDTERVTVNANTVSGFVYLDSDSSGTRNGAETGLGVGVQVTISGTTFFGEAFTQTVTADPTTGAYTFSNVPRSDAAGYTISETQPGAYVDGLETVGTLFGGTKSDALNSNTITSVVVPVGSQAATGYNFGEVQGSSLSGFTYLDLNNDGTKQGGETGLGTGLPVTLTGTDIFGQPVSLSGTSDPTTGAYSFPGLRPSNASGYTITENDAAVVSGTYFDGQDTTGSLNGTPAGTVTGTSPKFDAINVTVGQNQTGTGYNFAEIQKSSFSGNVYADVNGNGTFDAFEKGIPGVSITLTGTDDQGTPVNLTVTTNASGAYTFANIRPSNGAGYTISETQPADYLDGADTIGTPGGTTNNDSFTAVVLGAGVNGANNNFGEAPNFALTKTLVSTSEAGTSGNNVAIGEVATFRLVVTIPAGQLSDFQVQDFLPAGYAYVNGSARAGLVGAVTSSTISAALAGIGSTPTFVLPDAAVSSSATANTDSYASGTDVFFKFGDLTNPDTTAATEAVVIEFNAVVVNEATNQSGVTLTNSFGVLYDRDGVPGPEPDPNPPGTPPNVNTTVVTPVLSFAKTATPVGAVSAGDAITYTLTFTNTGTSTAFDALVRDVMPADILITGITGTALAGGATADGVATITGGGTGLSGQYDVPVGGSVTITYTGTVQVSAAPGSQQINNAELTWTSINGNNSLTPDAGERYGATGTLYGDGNLNNLRRVDSQTVTIGTAAFDKQLFGTSDPATAGSNVAIGELVTYALIVTGPAGTAPSLSVVDSLPAGLQYVSSSIVTTAAVSNGFLTQDFNGTVPAPTVSGGAADGDDVTFNFGAITVAADGNSQNNTFLILITAKVTDVPANSGLTPPGQTPLNNTATFEIPGDGVPPTTPPPVRVDVVEAQLTIDKTFNVPDADAGDTVQVTVVVGNTGTGPAHDVLLTDIVDLTKFGNITEVTTPAGFIFNNASGTVTYTGGSIAAGGSATFTFSVKLGNGVNPSEILSNTATATATSQPGIVTGERTFGPVTDTATLPVPAVFNLTKGVTSPAGGKVQIGDVVTYQVTVRIIEGTTQNISLSDVLPAGMSYVAGSAVVSNANGMTVNGFNASAAGQTLTLTAASVTNPGDVDDTATTDSDIFTITYQAVVNDVSGNVAGTLLTNNLTGGGTGVPPSTPPPVTVTVTEPQLRVTKAASPATANLGQTVHFTLSIQNLSVPNGGDAFDILVRDVLPAGLSGITGVTVNGANVDTNNSTGTVLDLKLDQLALGATATVEFDAVVSTSSAFAGQTIDNNARIYWDSQAGESPNSALTGTPDGDEDHDYGATTGYTEDATPTPDDPAQDTERLTITSTTLNGIVYHDANASGSFDVGDTGLAGQTVTLTGTTIFGEAINIPMVSGLGGTYTFANLAPGTYTLTETQPVGYLDGAETAGTFGGTVDNALGSNTISSFTIPAGNNTGTNYNFGEVLASSLSGYVYADANNDGIRQGGEATINGVTVQITGTDFLGQNVSITTTTAGGGAYTAANLRPGNYTITETQPGAFFDGQETVGTQLSGTVDNTQENNTISAITLTQGVDGAENNFGELAPASLSGIVFDDRNNDGNVDLGEAGLGGVTITLTGTDDRGNPVTQTVTTQPDGTYSFPGLRPGTYSITETQPLAFLDGKDVSGSPVGSTAVNDTIGGIVLGAGIDGANHRFGELTPALLSGVVFSDLDNNGAQGVGEAGIGGVTVTLTGTDDLGNPVNTTIQTQPDGTYNFGNLRPGNYTISETQPGAYLDGKDTAGVLGGSTAVNDVISGITVNAAQSGTGNTFAELPASSLSGSVFIDSDNDGIFDAGESGQVGVTITLTGNDDLGSPVSLTTTSLADGSYTFGGLRPSDAAGYSITETQPAGLFDGKNAVGSAGGLTVNNPPSDLISNVVLGANVNATDYNFGELRASSLSGLVFDDRNNDGLQGPGENGIGSVTITLTGTDDLGNPVNTTIQTQPDGSYSFPGLRPGTYSISETTPAGLLDGKDTIGTPGGTSGNDLFSNIVLAEGTDGVANNFAELTPATLSGNIFIDSDNDGVRDAGETGLGGQTVTLTGTDDLGNPVNTTVQTQADGTYSFSGLRPGTYSIAETQPVGYLDGKDTAGSLGGTVGADSVSAIVVNPANTGTDYNFAELRPGTISGTVFRDDSNDGTQQVGEPPLVGVDITLTGTDDLGNVMNTTVQTQADGSYSFPGLRPGTYTISETTPNGYLDGKDTLGTAGGTLGNDVISNVVLGENQTASGYTFGEILASSVSGHVYSDLNNNGVVDPGETGISGVTISLTGTDDLGQAVALNVQTDPNGDYTFINLRPGTYRINEAQPNGYLDGKNSVGTGAGGATINNPPSDLISNVVVNSNTLAAGYNFGEIAPATISGNVFEDMEDDGLRGPGDGSIPGTTLVLTGTDDLGNAVNLQVNTNAAGDFVFSNLRPGTYTLTEVQPGGYLDGKDTIGTAGGTKTNDRFSDITLNSGQTGNGYLFAERRPAPAPTTPDLYVFKTDNLTSARPGTRLTYVITGGNAGDATASGVVITDTLPKGVKFVSASDGGKLSGSKVVWNIGDVVAGGTFRVTVTVVVEQQIGGENLINTVTVKDRFGSPNDPTPKNNRATDTTFVPAFAFDSFNNFSRDRLDLPVVPPPGSDVDVWRPDPLTLVPVYSGEADPGATLSIELFNANGDRIGEQVAVVDAGGNWFVSFPSSNMRDYPASVRIVELRAPYADADVAGRNLRNFFVPAIHAGHFSFGGTDSTVLDPRVTAPLLGELDRGNPFALGETVKYNVELLPNTGSPSGR